MANPETNRIADNVLSAGSTIPEEQSVEGGLTFLHWLTKSGELAPPWWSPSRDRYLANFWKRSNFLSMIVYNAQAKLAGIPFIIEPVDPSITKHVDQAEAITTTLTVGSEFMQGVGTTLEKFYEDLLTSDNGAFIEILSMNNSDPAGPIRGMPIAIRHLDSQRVVRTSDREYPVKVLGDDGKEYKLHWSRLIHMSQMPSSRKEMHGVGFCAVSRSIDVAQRTVDVIRYSQERLGSRPPNQIILGKGISGKAIMGAMKAAEQDMSNRGFSRYSRTVAIGSTDTTDIDLEIKQLAHMDPFDEETIVQHAIYEIAGAFGLDVSEVWPIIGGSRSADAAKLQNMRARGKLPAQVTASLAHQFNTKFLPPYLKLRFDFRDDQEDQQRAIIRDIRGRQRERDIGNGSMTIRVARQEMLRDGDITRSEFNELEWESGRMEDGSDLYLLFFTQDEPYATILNLGIDNPLDFGGLDTEMVRSRVAGARAQALAGLSGTRARGLTRDLHKCLAVLSKYEKDLRSHEMAQIAAVAEEGQVEDEVNPDEENEGDGTTSMGQTRKPGTEKGIPLSAKAREVIKGVLGYAD